MVRIEISFRNRHQKTAHSMAQTEKSIFMFMFETVTGLTYTLQQKKLIEFSFSIFAKSITILLALLFYLSSHHTLASFPPFLFSYFF